MQLGSLAVGRKLPTMYQPNYYTIAAMKVTIVSIDMHQFGVITLAALRCSYSSDIRYIADAVTLITLETTHI